MGKLVVSIESDFQGTKYLYLMKTISRSAEYQAIQEGPSGPQSSAYKGISVRRASPGLQLSLLLLCHIQSIGLFKRLPLVPFALIIGWGLAAYIGGKQDANPFSSHLQIHLTLPFSFLFFHTWGKTFCLREQGLLTPFKAKTFSVFLRLPTRA